MGGATRAAGLKGSHPYPNVLPILNVILMKVIFMVPPQSFVGNRKMIQREIFEGLLLVNGILLLHKLLLMQKKLYNTH